MGNTREDALREEAAKRGMTLEEARNPTTHKIGFWGTLIFVILVVGYGCVSMFR